MPYVVVSCHAERLGEDQVWRAYDAFRARLDGDLRVATLMRPPEPWEDDEQWSERAHDVSRTGPFGVHTHFVSPTHARPPSAGPEHAERVRAQVTWVRGRGLEPRFFCGGGWFIDRELAYSVATLGLADCTATAFRPAYLSPDAPRLELHAPARLQLDEETSLVEVPSTHSIGMAARAAVSSLRTDIVHVYFHDGDLLDSARRRVLLGALRVLARRCTPSDLDEIASGTATPLPERPWP